MLKRISLLLVIFCLCTGCSALQGDTTPTIQTNTPAPTPATTAMPLSPEQEIEAAVSDAILAYNQHSYGAGEAQTEGHVILDTAQDGEDRLIAYCVVSYGEFGFENGIFTKISGSGAIPIAITFSRDGQGVYTWEEYKEMPDGGSYADVFPKELLSSVPELHQYYGDLLRQEEAQAREYVASIGRGEAIVSGGYVEKSLATSLGMDVEASNELLHLFGEYPSWTGTLERLEDGVRYVYSKAYNADTKIVTFVKEKEDGTVVEQYVIDTTGGGLRYLEGEERQ